MTNHPSPPRLRGRKIVRVVGTMTTDPSGGRFRNIERIELDGAVLTFHVHELGDDYGIEMTTRRLPRESVGVPPTEAPARKRPSPKKGQGQGE